MPLYDYHCRTCGGARADVFNRMADCESNAPRCCDSPMSIVIQRPMVTVQAEAHYVCPATGEKVTSWRQRRNIFAKHRLRDANDHPPEQVIRDENRKWDKIRERAKAAVPDELKHIKLEDLLPATG